jgi:hypothetical protein
MRSLICLTLFLSLAVPGCARNQTKATANKDQIEVTGCVTSNPESNQFVLTANANALSRATGRAAAGEAETYSYQLVSGTNLQDYVGREVTVKGIIEGHGKDVDFQEKEKTVLPETKSGDKDVTPAIKTKEEIELQVEQLRVDSINPTGSPCQIGTKQ